MNYYDEIKKNLIKCEIYEKSKDFSKNKNRVITYFGIGKLLNEAGRKYGDKIIDEYSKKLVVEVGKKFNKRTLFRMRQFYVTFNNEKVSPLATQLTWSHYTELLSLKDCNKIKYYINVTIEHNLSKRELREKIRNKEYERLSESTKTKLVKLEELKIGDLVPNPIIIKSNILDEEIGEYALKQLILNNLDDFLLQLGNGFTYVGNEYKIKLGDRYNYIDLLLFNYEFNCFVVVELKVVELKKEHIGQVQVYMNYLDDNVRKINQNKTVGIIICKLDNKYVIKYCSDDRVIARKYEIVSKI